MSGDLLGTGDGLADTLLALLDRGYQFHELIPARDLGGYEAFECLSGFAAGLRQAFLVLGSHLRLDTLRKYLEGEHQIL